MSGYDYWWQIENGYTVTTVENVTVDTVGDGGPGWGGKPEVFYDGPPSEAATIVDADVASITPRDWSNAHDHPK